MSTTNLLTFEVHFKNSTDTFITNVSNQALTELCKFINNYDYIFDKVKEYHKSQSKFKQCNKQRFLDCIDHNTELHLLILRAKN